MSENQSFVIVLSGGKELKAHHPPQSCVTCLCVRIFFSAVATTQREKMDLSRGSLSFGGQSHPKWWLIKSDALLGLSFKVPSCEQIKVNM
jgi:hypothetical protein